jgi:hypothetical protein
MGQTRGRSNEISKLVIAVLSVAAASLGLVAAYHQVQNARQETERSRAETERARVELERARLEFDQTDGKKTVNGDRAERSSSSTESQVIRSRIGTQASPPGKSTEQDSIANSPGSSGSGSDLVKLLDLQRDSVGAQWFNSGGVLISPSGTRTRLQFPIVAGDKYRISFVARRVSNGSDTSLQVGLPVGKTQVVLILDGTPDYHRGLSLVDGKRANENSTGTIGRLFTPNEWVQVTCTVEPGHVSAMVAGKRVVFWEGTFSRLSIMDRHAVPRTDVPFLGTVSSRYEFRNISLTPL